MIRRFLVLLVWALVQAPGFLYAQALPGVKVSEQTFLERIDENHYRATGVVEMEFDAEGMRLSADQVDYYLDTRRLTAEGHVVFVSRDSRISAERADFNTRTKTGTFFNAYGSALLGEQENKTLFGTQEPDAYFYGETIEKLGPDKYRVTKGGFTTCVQPTPRWEIVSTSTTVRLDHYALLKNAVLKVKDVPMFYLPAMYYPIQKDDRATGFLMPVYGSSTAHGSSISNAFFWAINRSQDATLFHDWFTSSGQGYGGEYRYVSGPGSNGNFSIYRLTEDARTVNGATQPPRESFEMRAAAVQKLPLGLQARGNIDYFSDVTVQQQYNQNITQATLATRSYGGNLTGNWGADNVSLTYDFREIFNGDNPSDVYGSQPRLSYSRAPTRLGALPVFFTGGGEFVTFKRSSRRTVEGTGEVIETDFGLSRADFSPQLQFPYPRLSFLTVRSSLTYHATRYSESLEPYLRTDTPTPRVGYRRVQQPFTRQYVDMQSRIIGPIFSKVWNTPENGYAERFKHLIEPELTINRTTNFLGYDRTRTFEDGVEREVDGYSQIEKIDGYDYVVGGTTRLTYGVTQRFLARRTSGPPQAKTQEFLNVSLQQTYYSNPLASTVDGQYSGGYLGREPSNFSPIALTARVTPTPNIGGSVRLEYNTDVPSREDETERGGAFETIQIAGNVNVGTWLQQSANWSQRRFFDVNDPNRLRNNFIGSRTNLSFSNGRYGGAYDFDLSVTGWNLIQHRILLFYNAQCCGIAFEYQSFNFPTLDQRFIVPQDRRFNISFTLAGVGSFSNFLGAFGIGQGVNNTFGGRR